MQGVREISVPYKGLVLGPLWEGGMKPKLGGRFEVAVSLVRGFKMQSSLMSCAVSEKEEGAGQSHASWCPVPHVHIQIPIVLKAVSPAREMQMGPADSLLLSPRTFEISPS